MKFPDNSRFFQVLDTLLFFIYLLNWLTYVQLKQKHRNIAVTPAPVTGLS